MTNNKETPPSDSLARPIIVINHNMIIPIAITSIIITTTMHININ